MKKILSEPLIHFLFIGAVLFVGYDFFKDSSSTNSTDITITAADIKTLQANFTRTWSRPPTEKELDALIEELIRDEIALREAKAMGLDKEDVYIRKRLRTKLELLLDDFAEITSPNDTDLQQYLQDHRKDFSIPPLISLQQIYFDPKKAEGNVTKRMQTALETLVDSHPPPDPRRLGDVTMLPFNISLASPRMVSRQFGSIFTDEIMRLPVGVWSGPAKSGYGFHLVKVVEKKPARTPPLSEVRDQVEREWMAKRRQEIKEQTYENLRKQYTVSIDSATEKGRTRDQTVESSE